jgi:electron transfer DM13
MPRKLVLWTVAGVAAVVLVAAALWFAPWKLFTNTTVHDQLAGPTATATAVTTDTSAAVTPAAPVVLAQGAFISGEHDTTGTARIVRKPDGSTQLELVGLVTSDGPDLRVWLSDQPVTTGIHRYSTGRHLELGRLKGNRGDQVYRIPAGTDLHAYQSVTIWCIRFSVSFGAAALAVA